MCMPVALYILICIKNYKKKHLETYLASTLLPIACGCIYSQTPGSDGATACMQVRLLSTLGLYLHMPYSLQNWQQLSLQAPSVCSNICHTMRSSSTLIIPSKGDHFITLHAHVQQDK